MGGDRPGRRSCERLADALASTGGRIQRLRMTVLGVAGAAVLLVAGVLWLGGSAGVDPTRRAVDDLDVPAWAAAGARDETYGSRWCVGECRVRVRTASSEGTVDDTRREYRTALRDRGWRPAARGACVGGGEGECHVRDELFLELWVVPAACSDPYEPCAGSEVTAVVASQAAVGRLAEDRRLTRAGSR